MYIMILNKFIRKEVLLNNYLMFRKEIICTTVGPGSFLYGSDIVCTIAAFMQFIVDI